MDDYRFFEPLFTTFLNLGSGCGLRTLVTACTTFVFCLKLIHTLTQHAHNIALPSVLRVSLFEGKSLAQLRRVLQWRANILVVVEDQILKLVV